VLHANVCSGEGVIMGTKAKDKAQTEKTNITLKLDRAVLRKIKILAAKRETSISALVTIQMEELVNREDGYEQAMKRSIARMKKGLGLGWQKAASRDELYDRKIIR
jgi:predicted transcriptional regulator